MALPVRRATAMAGLWPGLWLVAVGLECMAGGAAAWLAGRDGPALVAVLANLLVAGRFAVTLRPGAVPLISRYALHDPRGLPPAAAAYTRRLTLAWTVLLGVFALAHAATVTGAWSVATVALVQSLTCIAAFLGEHLLRSRVLPELGRATPWRTFRAIRNAAGARHGG